MFGSLLRFEIRYQTRNWLFLGLVLGFAAFGFALSAMSYRVPNIAPNSPYVIANIMSLLSLGGIFAASLLSANALLRDKESQMESFIFSTSVKKWPLLLSRLSGICVAVILAYMALFLGMALALINLQLMGEALLEFNLSTYSFPLLYIAIPNLLIVSLLTFSTAVISRNRIITYLGGLGLYIFYMIGAMFLKAPWLASPSPPTPEEIQFAAKLDPFALSALIEQTRLWTLAERNALSLSFSGNLLHNRLLWLGLSLLISLICCWRYRFRLSQNKGNRSPDLSEKESPLSPNKWQKPQSIIPTSRFQVFWSVFKLETRLLWLAWPWRIFLILWTFVMGVETYNAIRGGSRMEDSEALSGIFANNIASALPFFAILGLLIFSNQILWRDRKLGFAVIVDSSPTTNAWQYLAKLLTCIQIPLSMLGLSLFLAVGRQLSKANFEIEIIPYLGLFYYLGLALIFSSVLVIFVQAIVPNRIMGLFLSGIFLLVASSSLVRFFGLDHLLVQYLQVIQRTYSELNGYGVFVEHYHWRMLYALSISVFLAACTLFWWPRGLMQAWKTRFIKGKRRNLQKWILFSGVGLLLSMSLMGFLSEIRHTVPRREAKIAWQLKYEQTYSPLAQQKMPHIEQIQAEIDLYPLLQTYEVSSRYELCNPYDSVITQAWVALHQVAVLDSLWGEGLKILQSDPEMGMYQIAFAPAIAPNENRALFSRFHASWSPFGELTPFNAIVGNGSFMRISRYFPLFGYQADWGLNNEEERKLLGLGSKDQIPQLAAPPPRFPYQNFIQWEATISTEVDQKAFSPGRLLHSWQEAGRAYFHYRADRPMPFRFALSSGRFAERLDSLAGVKYRILYDPRHQSQLDNMMTASQQTIAYCERAFAAYPFEELTIVEVSDFTEGFAATAYPNSMFIRESQGWYADPNDADGPNRVFLMMAHEIAHQWWGGQLRPSYREGATFLTESLAQYTAYMLYKEAFGEAETQKALKVEADLYFQNRGFSEERSLLMVSPDQAFVAYQKGAVVLYAIQHLIGEERLNEALAKLLQKHAYPQTPATSQDLLEVILAHSPQEHHSLIRQWIEDVCVEDVAQKLILRIPD